MNRTFTLLLFIALIFSAKAQQAIHAAQPYGKVDTADLKLTSCDFEKDANAEVLFDKAVVTCYDNGYITYLRHKRIKIFNDNGKDEANIKIGFIDKITDIEAETINITGKTIEYTPVDTKLIYQEKIDKHQKALIFTFPDVRPGSIIELQYKWKIFSDFVPAWYFQSNIPTRYSENEITLPAQAILINTVAKVTQPFAKDSDITIGTKGHLEGEKRIRALSNVRSYKDEPFMTPAYDNVQKLTFRSFFTIWSHVCSELINEDDFGKQLSYDLPGEKEILAKADLIENKDIKIDSIFSLVKSTLLWDKKDRWFTEDGLRKAWSKKTGNSTEINLILYRLLTSAGIVAYPMLVSTPDYGVVDPNDPSLSQFNKTVVYIPVDSLNYYILDATDKHNTFNQVPFDLLATYGLGVAPKTGKYSLFSIQSIKPAKQVVFVDAEIKPDGKMAGTADIVSDSYGKAGCLKLYNELGKKKYLDYLTDNNNSLKISSLKLDSVEIDSMPLKQHINFDLDLTASDENYIYFNPNLFTSFGTNPFLSENRYSNINFVYSNTVIISGIFKIPDNYKIDVLPKNQVMVTEDKGITFKRVIGEQDGAILVRYVINRKRNYYTKEEYPGLFKFYKKMFELLNEQIVLKKS